MKDILSLYQEHCSRHGVPYQRHESVLSYDDTTLFCPAGMQQYKSSYHNPDSTGTLGNCQSCLRLVDLQDIDDSTHYLHFNMLGLFSFREWTVPQTIGFWVSFLTQELGLRLDYVTVHPGCLDHWRTYYEPYNLEVRPDEECVWGDGELRGYCTEFYIDGVEIGNIVHTGGHSIDVGFGLERIQQFVTPGTENKTGEQVLRGTIDRLLLDGVVPGNKRHGYVLRKLMRLLLKRGGDYSHPLYEQERRKLDRMVVEYHRHKDRFHDKSPEWWLDTFGVDVSVLA